MLRNMTVLPDPLKIDLHRRKHGNRPGRAPRILPSQVFIADADANGGDRRAEAIFFRCEPSGTAMNSFDQGSGRGRGEKYFPR